MAYRPCDKCGAINRSEDTTCFQCGAEMGEAPPPPAAPAPPPPSEVPPPASPSPAGESQRPAVPGAPVVSGGAPASEAAYTPYYAAPSAKSNSLIYADYPVIDRESDANQGIRSGALAGLVTGIGFGAYHFVTHAPIFQAFIGTNSPPMMAGAAVVRDLLMGMVLGCLLGALNKLYFVGESTRVGLFVGAVVGGVLFLVTKRAEFLPVVVAACHGAALGLLSSVIERKLFR